MENKHSKSQVLKHSLKYFLLSFTFSLFFSCAVQGQEASSSDKKALKAFEKAREYYASHNYPLAKEELNTALERDPSFVEALTLRAYIAMDEADFMLAKKSLKKAVETNSSLIPNNLFFLGEIELKMGEYENAKSRFEQFIQQESIQENQYSRAQESLRRIDFALQAKQNPVPFDPINLGPEVNSEFSEYFPCLTVDGKTLLYTRRLPEPNTPAGFNEDFYVSNYSNGNWTSSKNMGKPINTKLNEGAPSLSADGQLLIFTACELYGDYGGDRKGFGSCDLFYSSKKGGNWSVPYNLGQTINSRHWETQPSFSADGKTLYFVRGIRDRSGNRTGDIYFSVLNEENYWSKPEKLNANINTPGNEESVFIHPDGKTIYFSSDGHLGMGGLDIFVARKDSTGEWGKAVNLGYPINSYKNENSLLISADGQKAYFASDRENGFGGLDLYSFELPDAFKPEAVTYFAGKIFDRKTNKPLSAKFELIDLESEELIVESYSDPINGSFLVSLPSGKEYALNASKAGYLFYSENFNLKETQLGEAFEKNVPLNPIQLGEKIILKNIFFETGKYNLRNQSKVELNKLINFLNNNPKIKVEVSGHTDNVGNQQANQILSENRAKAVVDYLTKNGVDSSRIQAKGYGDHKPIADNETEEGRAKNRRTEFEIIGL